MKLIKLLVFLLFYPLSNLEAYEVKILAMVDNHIITNIDLINEIKTIEIVNNIKLTSKENPLILNNMIDDKIKYIETQNELTDFDQNKVNSKYNTIINKKSNLMPEIKKNIKYKLIVSSKWNNLIIKKFRGKLDINPNEIDQIIKNRKSNNTERGDIIIREREKKLNVISKTYFNEVKKKYLIKKL